MHDGHVEGGAAERPRTRPPPEPIEVAALVLPARGPVPPGLQCRVLGLWWRSVWQRGHALALMWSSTWWVFACPVGLAAPNQLSEWALVLLGPAVVGGLDAVSATTA